MVIVVIIALLLTLFYGTLMVRYGKIWNQAENTLMDVSFQPKISILIAFRNEAENLPYLLKDLENQSFDKTKFEIIWINDHSSDDGQVFLEQYKSDLRMQVIHLKSSQKGKKSALKQGWEVASGDIIVHTDADVRFGKNWLKSMVEPFQNRHIDFVSGPVAFFEQQSFWNQLMQLEFAGLVVIGAVHIFKKKPLICNGANLAFRRKFLTEYNYDRQKQFSGDDVFLMEHIHRKHPGCVFFTKNPEAMVRTNAPESLKSFLWQRIRWSRKNHAYQDKGNVAILVLVWLFHVMMLLCLFSFTEIGMVVLLLMQIVKILVDNHFFEQIHSFFGLTYKIKFAILGAVFHSLYIIFVPLIAKLISVEWKERKWK